MRLLVVGAGVIGTVYGAILGAAGHSVSVLAHGSRTDAIAREGLRARDVIDRVATNSPAAVAVNVDDQTYDLVLIALRRDDLPSTAAPLAKLRGEPLVVFFGNNPRGRAGLPAQIPGHLCLGFPGIGGTMSGGVAEYARIPQQPTAFETHAEPRLTQLQGDLERQGFAVQRVADMSGWLAYHAVFVACVSAALYHYECDPRRLADDRAGLTLMCRAITDGFGALRRQGVAGLPRNLALLHSRALLPLAVGYWAHSMRSTMGELAFAAHSRHAEAEMRAVARDVLARIGRDERRSALYRLLSAER